ncbi:MAG: FkbM family methyltransferase [Verrucomicrobiaceae bacterium]|nr:MAG: FkbM family methyltransferase [Verrucomicrobiaceae bacterium]
MKLIPDRLKFRWSKWQLQRREQWWAKHEGENRSIMHPIQDGVAMNLYLDSELCKLIYYKHFEAHEREFMNAFLRPGDTFVDVGANIGLFSLIAARVVGPSGRVFSFEPTPLSYSRLQENIQANGFNNVRTFQLALSDEEGSLEFSKSVDGFDAWNSPAAPAMGSKIEKEQVQATTWDKFSVDQDLNGKITMMKIDVEGWESRVLAGARESLKCPDAPLLQVEFTEEAAILAGSTCAELYRSLESLGYGMCVFNADKRCLVPDPIRESYPYQNLFAVKDLAAANSRLRSAG